MDERVDYYGVDSLLSEEERTFRDRIRKFVDEECLPVIADHFNKATFPMHLISRMADLGLFGLHVDGYGCSKASHTIYGLVCQELGRNGMASVIKKGGSIGMCISYPSCPN